MGCEGGGCGSRYADIICIFCTRNDTILPFMSAKMSWMSSPNSIKQKTVMSFKLENFVAAPSMELLNLAKKTDLLNIADHYALTSVKPSMLKHEIKNILIKFLVDEEILDPSALSSILVTQTDLQLRELEVQRQIQLEKLRLEQEERIRVEQLEREERKLEREERMQKEKLAMEKEKLEMEERIQKEKLEQAEKEKERQYNLRMKELEMQDKAKTKPLDLGTHFDVTKHI